MLLSTKTTARVFFLDKKNTFLVPSSFMPARVPARKPSRRQSLRRCAKPSCLCNRSLGANLLEARDFRVVTCSYGCKRPQYYFHASCASLYVQSLRTCGYCKAKLIPLDNARNKSLRETLHTKRLKRRRRRVEAQVVSLYV